MTRDWMVFAWGMFTVMGAAALIDGRWLVGALLLGLGCAFNALTGDRPRP